jgi:membrane protein
VLTLVIWVLASFVLRGTLTASVRGGTSIYGPLSTPIVLLIFLYALAIAVLIGAALNAAIRTMWPVEDRLSLPTKAVAWVRGRMARRKTATTSVNAPGGADRDRSAGADDADEELSSSVKALREEARKPLTPMPGGPGTDDTADTRHRDDTGDAQFGDDADDRIMSARTRSG